MKFDVQSKAILLVKFDDLFKGHTLNVIDGVKSKGDASVIPDGCTKVYQIPNKYLMYPNEDIEFPKCQEISEVWGYGKA